MGTTCCCLNPISSLEPSDWINIIGIFINSALAFWIVKTIQNRLTNKRSLKDHFINEIKEIRNEYKTCLSNLYSNKTQAESVISWFKLMNIKVNDLMLIINAKYKIDSRILTPYQNDLRELVTNNVDFTKQFKSKTVVKFTENSKSSFIRFEQEHNNLFNNIIVKINDAI